MLLDLDLMKLESFSLTQLLITVHFRTLIVRCFPQVCAFSPFMSFSIPVD